MSTDDLPEWAKITSDLVDDAPTADEGAHPVPLPQQRPRPPARPVAIPANAPAAGQQSAVPLPTSAPEPVQVRVAPMVAERQAPEPVEAVEPMESAVREPAVTVTPRPLVEAQPESSEPFTGPMPPPKKTRKAKRQPRTPKTSVSKRDGRKKLLVIRLVVWLVLGIVAVAGLKAILSPPKTNIAEVTASVADAYDLTTFPVERGRAVALSFAQEYLTLNPGDALARKDRLAALVTPNLADALWIRNDSDATQVVVEGPYLAWEAEASDEQHATYKIAAAVIDPVKAAEAKRQQQTLNPSWVYLSVPIFWASNGGLAVGGPPAFMPGPPRADSGGAFGYASDDKAASSLAVDLEGFFTAWAASSTADLARYLPPDASPATQAGLGGTVQFKSLDAVSVEKVADPTASHFAQATVTWSYQGADLRQGYRLDVFQDADGRWYIRDVVGGDFQ